MEPTTAESYLDTPLVRILAGDGDGRKEFAVHQGLLCSASVWFTNTLQGPWKEAAERKITLAEHEPEIVRLYLESLYSQQVSVKHSELSTYNTLARLYVLADFLGDDAHKAAILQSFEIQSGKALDTGRCYLPGPDTLQYIYENTPENSPAQALMVKLYAFCRVDISSMPPGDLPQEFTHSLAVEYCNEALLAATAPPPDLLEPRAWYRAE